MLIPVLQRASRITDVLRLIQEEAAKHSEDREFMASVIPWLTQGLEALITDGWVVPSYDPKLPLVPVAEERLSLKWNKDPLPRRSPL